MFTKDLEELKNKQMSNTLKESIADLPRWKNI